MGLEMSYDEATVTYVTAHYAGATPQRGSVTFTSKVTRDCDTCGTEIGLDIGWTEADGRRRHEIIDGYDAITTVLRELLSDGRRK